MRGHISEASDCDAVLFCSERGVRAKLADESYLKNLRLDENRQLLGAIDSGALLLGKLGFLKGKAATTYPTAENKTMLESFGATVVCQSLVESGNVATAAQCLSGRFLAGWIIENLAGAEAKEKALRSVESLDDLEVSL